MKLAVIGAGSTYTPELVDGLVRMRDLLPLDELALCDLDAERLRVLTGMTKRMLERGGHPANVTSTERLEEAVEGADAVLIQLRVGGQAVRIVEGKDYLKHVGPKSFIIDTSTVASFDPETSIPPASFKITLRASR